MLKLFRSHTQLFLQRHQVSFVEHEISLMGFKRTRHANEISLNVDFLHTVNEEFVAGVWDMVFPEPKKCHQFLELILPDEWCRYFFVSFPINAQNSRDLHAACQRRFEQLYGDNVDEWNLCVDWQFQTSNLVCAIPKYLDTALHVQAKKRGQVLLKIESNFIHQWNRCAPSLTNDTMVIVFNQDGFLMALNGKNGLQDLRQYEVSVENRHPLYLRSCIDQENLRSTNERAQKLVLMGEVWSELIYVATKHEHYWIVQCEQLDAIEELKCA